MGYELWPRPARLTSFGGAVMRMQDDIRDTVAFIGHGEDDHFTPVGTGFFVDHKGYRYFVTAQHIAAGLGDDPFSIRINMADETYTLLCDPLEDPNVRWIVNEHDANVDLAIMPFPWDMKHARVRYLKFPSSFFATANAMNEWDVGIGDTCYAVGLFRLMKGQKQNLPIVHTGHIALMPGDQLIPVRDWLAPPETRKTRHVEGYLVELTNLKGLSGSPVFVRPSLRIAIAGTKGPDQKEGKVIAPTSAILLLGMWQNSWDALPDEVMVVEHGTEVRVPIGLGSVVPAYKILEVLDSPKMDEIRREHDAMWEHQAAIVPDRGGAS